MSKHSACRKGSSPSQEGEKRTGAQNTVKQTNWNRPQKKGRRLFVTARGQRQTRKVPRRNLKCHKTWFVTCKVQWDLNGSTTPERRTATSVASLQDGQLQHQNFIVSGFKPDLSQAALPFLSRYLHYLFLLFPLYSYFLFFFKLWLGLCLSQYLHLLCNFPSSKKAIDVAFLSPV